MSCESKSQTASNRAVAHLAEIMRLLQLPTRRLKKLGCKLLWMVRLWSFKCYLFKLTSESKVWWSRQRQRRASVGAHTVNLDELFHLRSRIASSSSTLVASVILTPVSLALKQFQLDENERNNEPCRVIAKNWYLVQSIRKIFFCSCNLPLASIGWVRSTLSSNCCTLTNYHAVN